MQNSTVGIILFTITTSPTDTIMITSIHIPTAYQIHDEKKIATTAVARYFISRWPWSKAASQHRPSPDGF